MAPAKFGIYSAVTTALILTTLCFSNSLPAAIPSLVAQGKGVEDRDCRHILTATEAQADALIARLGAGESFAKLARRHSFDVVTKPLAGELGWIAGAQYEPAFMQAAYSVKDVNGIVKCKTRHGWHIIQVTEIKNPGGRKPPAAVAPNTPTSQPDAPGNRPRPTINKDVAIEFELINSKATPGEPVTFEIRMRNDSKVPQNVFNPSLWPLGLTVRYQFGKLNVALAHPETSPEPASGFSRYIDPGETLSQRFELQKYTGDLEAWPIIRMNWRANVFFATMEKSFPSIRGVDGYDQTRDAWRFYASRVEQRLNVLPEYSPDQRWFVMLHSRGKIWVELKDPGVPGLMAHWIGLIRDGVYDRQLYSDYVEGSHFSAGGVNDDGSGQVANTFALPVGAAPKPVAPFSLALELGRSAPGAYVAGSRFFLTLDQPRIPGGAIEVGRIVAEKGSEVLTALSENYKIRGQAPRTMLALAYPYDLLPPEVKSAVDGAEAAPASSDPKPGIGEVAVTPDPGVPAVPKGPLPIVVFKTDYGAIGIELFEDDCPNTVANFVELVEKRFYDGLIFHRKWMSDDNKGFIQGGSPDGTMDGHAGHTIADEASPHKHVAGAVAMARGSGKNSASCQFYICIEDQPSFDGFDTVFGRVVEGLDVIAAMPKGTKIFRCGVQSKRDHDYRANKISIGDSRKK